MFMKEEQLNKKAYYHDLYREWKSSGDPVGLFCERVSVKYCTFRYWVKRIEEESNEEPCFTQLGVSGFPTEALAVVGFPGGCTLSFYHLPDPVWLKALLS